MPSFPSRALALALAPLLAAPLACAKGRPAQGTRDPAAMTSSEIRNTPGDPIERLAARVPGVQVSRAADGGLSIRIRGGSSINGSNEPLYILDGVPIQPGPNGSLSGINPNDIDRIEVLKDAASTTMYGSRGANGVIRIYTRRPGQ